MKKETTMKTKEQIEITLNLSIKQLQKNNDYIVPTQLTYTVDGIGYNYENYNQFESQHKYDKIAHNFIKENCVIIQNFGRIKDFNSNKKIIKLIK